MATPSRFVPQMQRNPIILEIGSKFVKVGFASDAAPTAIVPSLGRLPNGKLISLVGPMRLIQRMEILTSFLSDLYFKILLCNSKDRKVIVLLNPFETHDLEKALLSVLLTVLEVPSVSFVSPHMTIFPGVGAIHTGLIVDIGNVTRIIPVSHNAAIVGSWEVLPHIGFSGLVRLVKETLKNGCEIKRRRNPSIDSEVTDETEKSSNDYSDSSVCDINAEELCLELVNRWLACTTSTRSRRLAAGEEYGPDFPPFPDISRLTVAAGDNSFDIKLHGRFLEKIMEIFFQPDIDGRTLPSAILEVILKCPIDLRKAMMQNIIVVGGMAATKNFIPRLNAELFLASQEDHWADRLRQPKFRFISTEKIPPNIVGWRGCSVLTHADYFPEHAAFSREDYMLRGSPNNVSSLLKEWCFVGKDRRISR